MPKYPKTYTKTVSNSTIENIYIYIYASLMLKWHTNTINQNHIIYINTMLKTELMYLNVKNC